VSGGGQAMNQLCKVETLKAGAPKQKLLNWKGLDKREALWNMPAKNRTLMGIG